mmetsp:Transcript_25966/g.65903  ORF Transcript_25966/g.65903 Transcript_25966/m.65903 type:complete len:207 (-) Transcript_25966:1738-2358(-)
MEQERRMILPPASKPAGSVPVDATGVTRVSLTCFCEWKEVLIRSIGRLPTTPLPLGAPDSSLAGNSATLREPLPDSKKLTVIARLKPGEGLWVSVDLATCGFFEPSLILSPGSGIIPLPFPLLRMTAVSSCSLPGGRACLASASTRAWMLASSLLCASTLSLSSLSTVVTFSIISVVVALRWRSTFQSVRARLSAFWCLFSATFRI